MTREEAIYRLNNTAWLGSDADRVATEQAVQMASEALQVQKTGRWTNHEVACLLADLFDDTCACNYNGIDEWLPKYCEVIDACPNPVGVACWEQFLTHRVRMRGEEE